MSVDLAPGGAAADFAEDRLSARQQEPLHVRETGAEAERLDDPLSHLAAARQFRDVHVLQADRLGRDPLDGARKEGAGAIPGDVLVEDPPVRADGIEGVLLAPLSRKGMVCSTVRPGASSMSGACQ